MKNLAVYLILCVCIAQTSCKKDKKLSVDAQVLTDISFGEDPKQKMDVHLPESRNEQTPVVVMLHGGGFVAGDKTAFSARAQQLAAKGFVVLNVNYRLVSIDGVFSNPIVHKPSPVKISDQLNDIAAAVNLAASKSGEWRMSNDKWSIAGHSAGATLALLYAYGDKNTGGRVKVAANWAGATNFAFQDESEVEQLDPRIAEIIYRAVGAEPVQANIPAYMAVSPMWLAIQGRGLATINIRPEFNNVGDLPDGSKVEYQKFTQVLNDKGVTNKWVEVAGADHGFSKAGNWDLVMNETAAFFNSN
ncbi:alpha/beta hydrolase [Parapedobacter tibetensis]|uniref:alpha/beta hydrolase n=1 Tax=Parapedobacter tibetensis TaxID=2972951 RepID=UPI00214D14EA|nr:alpha/beta hydrolase [Parapedobacter tibetensis]